MITELTKDQKAVKAAFLLTSWNRTHRNTVSVTYEDHQELLNKIQPNKVVIQKLEEDQEPKFLFVIHDKKKATEFLSKEYGLHYARVRRNT